MKRLGALGIVAACLVWAGAAMAQQPNLSNQPAYTIPLPSYSGPFEASQGQAYLNNLVVSLNGILGGYTGLQNGSGATTMFGVAASAGTTPVVISPVSVPGQTEGANVGFAIQSNGNGNITLFYGQGSSQGILAFGSAFAWTPGNGVDRCPGNTGGSQVIGTNSLLTTGGTSVTGFVPVQDWLGRTHKLVACG